MNQNNKDYFPNFALFYRHKITTMAKFVLITTQDLADFYKSRKGSKNRCGGDDGCICPTRDSITPISNENDFEKNIVRGRGHQRHISKEVAKEVANKLKGQPWGTMQFPTFEEFYLYVRSIVNTPGIGNLTVYDIATQLLKFFPGIAPMPKDYVYLARGAMEGAKSLLGSKAINTALKSTTPKLLQLATKYTGSAYGSIKRHLTPGVCVPTDLFRQFFPQLTAYEIEDVLCIYKIMLAQGGIDGHYHTMNDFKQELYRRKVLLRNSTKKTTTTKTTIIHK